MTVVVDDLQAQSEGLAGDTASQVLAIYTAYAVGQITREDATLLVVGIINRANAAAAAIADLFMSGQIEHLSGIATPTVGVTATDDADRLAQAIGTILDEHPLEDAASNGGTDSGPTESTGAVRFTRLARAETFEAGHQATYTAMQEQRLVEGWVRQFDADPCQLCRWWWREGKVWPKVHPFQRHKGCNCQPRVVLTKHVQSTGFSRRQERNQAP